MTPLSVLGVNPVILFDKRERDVKKVKNHCSGPKNILLFAIPNLAKASQLNLELNNICCFT